LPFQFKSLFHRTLLTLIPFLLAVTVLYSVLINMAINNTEDHIAKRYLEREGAALINASPEFDDKKNILLSTSYLRSYRTTDPNLPQQYKNFTLGYFELEDSDKHILVISPPESEEKIYLELNESAFSSVGKNEGIIYSVLFAVAGLVIITSLIPAVITARLISQPISDLARETQKDWQPGQRTTNR